MARLVVKDQEGPQKIRRQATGGDGFVFSSAGRVLNIGNSDPEIDKITNDLVKSAQIFEANAQEEKDADFVVSLNKTIRDADLEKLGTQAKFAKILEAHPDMRGFNPIQDSQSMKYFAAKMAEIRGQAFREDMEAFLSEEIDPDKPGGFDIDKNFREQIAKLNQDTLGFLNSKGELDSTQNQALVMAFEAQRDGLYQSFTNRATVLKEQIYGNSFKGEVNGLMQKLGSSHDGDTEKFVKEMNTTIKLRTVGILLNPVKHAIDGIRSYADNAIANKDWENAENALQAFREFGVLGRDAPAVDNAEIAKIMRTFEGAKERWENNKSVQNQQDAKQAVSASAIEDGNSVNNLMASVNLSELSANMGLIDLDFRSRTPEEFAKRYNLKSVHAISDFLSTVRGRKNSIASSMGISDAPDYAEWLLALEAHGHGSPEEESAFSRLDVLNRAKALTKTKNYDAEQLEGLFKNPAIKAAEEAAAKFGVNLENFDPKSLALEQHNAEYEEAKNRIIVEASLLLDADGADKEQINKDVLKSIATLRTEMTAKADASLAKAQTDQKELDDFLKAGDEQGFRRKITTMPLSRTRKSSELARLDRSTAADTKRREAEADRNIIAVTKGLLQRPLKTIDGVLGRTELIKNSVLVVVDNVSGEVALSSSTLQTMETVKQLRIDSADVYEESPERKRLIELGHTNQLNQMDKDYRVGSNHQAMIELQKIINPPEAPLVNDFRIDNPGKPMAFFTQSAKRDFNAFRAKYDESGVLDDIEDNDGSDFALGQINSPQMAVMERQIQDRLIDDRTGGRKYARLTQIQRLQNSGDAPHFALAAMAAGQMNDNTVKGRVLSRTGEHLRVAIVNDMNRVGTEDLPQATEEEVNDSISILSQFKPLKLNDLQTGTMSWEGFEGRTLPLGWINIHETVIDFDADKRTFKSAVEGRRKLNFSDAVFERITLLTKLAHQPGIEAYRGVFTNPFTDTAPFEAVGRLLGFDDDKYYKTNKITFKKGEHPRAQAKKIEKQLDDSESNFKFLSDLGTAVNNIEALSDLLENQNRLRAGR